MVLKCTLHLCPSAVHSVGGEEWLCQQCRGAGNGCNKTGCHADPCPKTRCYSFPPPPPPLHTIPHTVDQQPAYPMVNRWGRGRGEGADLELSLIPVIDLPPHWIFWAEAFAQLAEKDTTVEAGLKLCHRGEGCRQDNLHPPGAYGRRISNPNQLVQLVLTVTTCHIYTHMK